MLSTALRRRNIAWLALVAMLALALLPTVSHALAFAQGGKSAWAEICTPQGMKVVAVESAPGDEGTSVAAHLEHCPYCAQAATTLGMPPAPAAVAALALAAIEPPASFLNAPRTLFAWAAAQPRAPPFLS